jgi:quercetin dioxygenase-like cupin family protein
VQIVHLDEAQPYDAPRHHGMSTLRLQGADATPAEAFSVGLSITLPGGGAEHGSSPRERVYVVVDGRITVVADDGEHELGPLDSIHIAPGEARALENRTNRAATFLVVMSTEDGT